MARRSRQLTADERRLWAQAMRDAMPLDGRATLPPVPPPPAPPPPAAKGKPADPPAPRRQAPPPKPAARALDQAGPVDLDRRTWQRLRRGRVPIEGRLDLHGLTQSEAHHRLNLFLGRMQLHGARCILIITGRGERNGGILRRMTPRWLEESPNRDRIVTYASAQPQHGGEGALYVLLKRRR